MKKLKRVCSILPFLLLSPSIFAQPKNIKIATEEWKGYTNKDGTGLYFEIVNEIYRSTSIKLDIIFVPWARATKLVDDKQRDVLFGSYNNLPGYLYPDYPLNTELSAVIFHKDTIPNWKGVKDLEGKKIAWVRGYDYQNYIESKLAWSEVKSTKQGLDMLLKGRVDVYMDSLETLQKTIKSRNLDITKYEIKIGLEKNTYARFSNTKKSKQLIEIYNRNVKKMLKSGKSKEMYKKWNHRFPKF